MYGSDYYSKSGMNCIKFSLLERTFPIGSLIKLQHTFHYCYSISPNVLTNSNLFNNSETQYLALLNNYFRTSV